PKIHARGNLPGLPIDVDLNGAEAHDMNRHDDLMDQRESDPGLMLADKGYDSDTIRQDIRHHGGAPEIPTKSNRRIQHSVSKPLHALRARIECFIGHLKEQPRTATRYDETASSFRGLVLPGSIGNWIRYVHRA
ncbi:MAG: transposase, partial [Bradyrhizobium sp.]